MLIDIRPVSATELERDLGALVELLTETVNGGSPLGFVAPLAPDVAREYWRSLRPELDDGSRLLLAAYADDHLVGSGQLELAPWPNARHRAEIQKLLVTAAMRGRGVGASLMAALHDTARRHGRSLLLLNTPEGSLAERFYRALGYREVGVIPGYATGPAGTRYNSVSLYRELAP